MAEMMMMGAGFFALVSIGSSVFVILNKETLCLKYPKIPLLCPSVPKPQDTSVPQNDSLTPVSPTPVPGGGGGGGAGGGTSINRRFSPYVLLSNKATNLVGTKHTWTTLAFVVGYTNGKIQWDAGVVSTTALKNKIAAAKRAGGGVIISFGGQGAGEKGSKYMSELAGKYTDPQRLANAYEAIATTLSATWLDFDIEEQAVNDTGAIDRRNKAIYLLQKKRSDIRVSFTVPCEINGLDASTKALLTKAKNAGVRIDVVNLMTMYFAQKVGVMSKAIESAVTAAKPVIKELGAKVGITPLIGKNRTKGWTHEHLTSGDATRVVAFAKADPEVVFVSFWSLNDDSSKYKGSYTKTFKGFA